MQKVFEMNATLILMRHAEAVDRMEAEDDFERGLTLKGREDSAAVADSLADHLKTIDIALVSPAWRTHETYRNLEPQLTNHDMVDPMALYHASTDMLERAVNEALTNHKRILVVGHNPGLGGFAIKLASLTGSTDRIGHGYSPATASVFTLEDGDLSKPTLVTCVKPKS